jgi:arylsulfatase A-like enzyme
MLGTLMANAGYENIYIGKWHVGASFEKAGYTGEASDFRPDHKKTAAALSFLKGKHKAPFFLTVSFMNPHNVCELARGQELPDGPIPAPPKDSDDLPPLPDNFAIPENEPSALRKVKQSIPEHYPTRDWGELEWRQYLWGYYRLVEKVDGEIGHVLDALEASDYADNTVVVFVSDHGEGIAMHHWNQKQALYDQCTRVPLILAGPGIQQGKTSAVLASTALDIPQTLLDIAGASVPDSMRGLSLLALVSGANETLDRDYVVAETVFARNTDLLGLRGRMLRSEQYKYCVYDVGELREQLFDMTADPGETNNLAVQADYAELLKQQRATLAHWAAETNDNDFPYMNVAT